MKLTRDDKRNKALIVRPKGTQRILRPQQSSKNPASSFAGGSRSALSIGRGSGRAGGGGGGGIGAQASLAAALASSAMPALEGADVFAPQPVTPFVPPDTPGDDFYTGGATGNPVQDSMLGSTPGATLEQIVPGYTPPPPTSQPYVPDGGQMDAAVAGSMDTSQPVPYSAPAPAPYDPNAEELIRRALMARGL